MDLKEAKYTACVVRQLEEGQPNRALDALDWALAELARVKAQSLRVVPDGEACSMEDVDIWRCVDNMLGLYMYEKELLLCDDGTGLATPVRLERWEDEG